MDYEIIRLTKEGKVFNDDRRTLIEFLTTNNFTIYYVNIKKGKIVGNHYHDHKDEIIGIMEGKVKVCLINIITNEKLEDIMNTGDRITIPKYTAHALKSISHNTRLVSYSTKPFKMNPITKKDNDQHDYKVL